MGNINNKAVFADNLIFFLDARNVIQKELACAVGVSSGTVSDWLSCRSFPRFNKIQLIADFLKIEVSDLIEDRTDRARKHLPAAAYYSKEDIELFLRITKLSPQSKNLVKELVYKLQ